MKDSLRKAVLGFATFLIVCLLGTFGVLAIFAQLRTQKEVLYRAEFSDVTGLASGDFVRIGGVEVGKVKRISVTPKNTALVEFSLEPSAVLTDGSKAAIRWADPIGGRYMALLEGTGGLRRLAPNQMIPVTKTEPALDLDTLLGGFRPLLRALNPEQVNALSGQLIQAFQGEGATIGSFLTQAAAVTNTLANRDQLVEQTITNLNVVLGSLGEQSGQFGKAVDSLAQLVKTLAERKSDIRNAVAYTNAAARTIADFLGQARPALKDTVAQSDRVTSIVVADHEYFDNLLNTLPETYKSLSRLALYGDFFSFYLCDAILKVNGKKGQPVYIKLASQTTGRCAPK